MAQYYTFGFVICVILLVINAKKTGITGRIEVCFFQTSFGLRFNKISYLILQSCSGCSLNRLTDVKKFIMEDVPNYENVVFKPIQGAKPELVILDENDHETDRIPLSKLNRHECNQLLKKQGFKVKNNEL